jgi:hypothetical protein
MGMSWDVGILDMEFGGQRAEEPSSARLPRESGSKSERKFMFINWSSWALTLSF